MYKNKNSLNIFLDSERTYLSVISNGEQKPSVVYIDSFEKSSISEISEKLESIVSDLEQKPDEINIILSSEDYVLTQFPHTENISGEDLKNVIDFEIKLHFGEIEPENIICLLTPLDNLASGPDYVLMTFCRTDIVEQFRNLPFAKDKIIKCSFAAHATLNAFRYNYPDYSENTNLIIGFYQNYVDISILGSSGPRLVQYRNYSDIDTCIKDIKHLKNEFETRVSHQLQTIFVYGETLTQLILDKLKTSFPHLEIVRFNAFRKFRAHLDDRKKEYCTRTMHIYPPNVGAVLPDYTEHIEFL